MTTVKAEQWAQRPNGTRYRTDLTDGDCTCVFSCADDPATKCSLSGEFHVHPDDPCQVHPDAPGDR